MNTGFEVNSLVVKLARVYPPEAAPKATRAVPRNLFEETPANRSQLVAGNHTLWVKAGLPATQTRNTNIEIWNNNRMTDGWIVGWMDDWFWVQDNTKVLEMHENCWKVILDNFSKMLLVLCLWCATIQPSINPIIHGTAVSMLDNQIKIFKL